MDPEGDGLRRAVRAGITVPFATGLGLVVFGGTAAPLFTLLGSFWFMVLTDFPGNRQSRALAYLGLGVNGCALVALGTWVSPIGWLAVTLMFFLGVVVTVAGVASETISAGQRVTLLFYMWPACTPVEPIGERLLGLLLALAICLPASLFLLPPRHHSELRRHAAQVCAALADRIDGIGSAAAVARAMDALKSNFLAASFRPVGLSAGSRALVRIVDTLQLISDRVDANTAELLGAARRPASDVLRSCSRLVDESETAHRAGDWATLGEALPRLRSMASGRYREDVTLLLGEPDDAAAVATGRRLLTFRVLVTTIGLVGGVIAAAAVADARPVWARALGLGLPPTGFADRILPETVAAARIPTSFLTARSVTAQNALRTGIGLALAVAITKLYPVQHGFWVALGTMVVLGSSALTTGTKVIQAVGGTAVGVVLGSVLIGTFAPPPAVLWSLLPVAVLGSTYLPRLFSFAAGQAMIAFTVLVILDLMDPTGWRVGLLRIEDIAMGAAVGVLVSVLLWPRGATAAVSAVIASAVEADVRYLRAAVLRVTRGSSQEGAADLATLSNTALIRSRIVDDAVRHCLSETGGGADLRTPVVRAANRATWLRAAADMIADTETLPAPGVYPSARAVLEAQTDRVTNQVAVPGDVDWRDFIEMFVRALRAEAPAGPTESSGAIDSAQPLVAVAANLAELRVELIPTSQGDDAATRSPVS